MTTANDSILVTPGTGATVATHLVGGKEYQVVMRADSSGHILDSLPTYWAYADAVAYTQNKSMLSIVNTEAAAVVRLRKLFLINTGIVAVTGVMVRFEFRGITGHSAGTAVTPTLCDSANPAIPAGVTVRTGSTVAGEGVIRFAHCTTNEEVGATGTLISGFQVLAATNLLPEGANVQEWTLRTNEGLTVKQTVATTVGSIGALLVFTVE